MDSSLRKHGSRWFWLLPVLGILCIVCSWSDFSSPLRGLRETAATTKSNKRQLVESPDLGKTFLESLVQYFKPALESMLQSQAHDNMDPLVLSNATSVQLSDKRLGTCEAKAHVVYDEQIMHGLESLKIDAVGLAPHGTHDTEVHVSGGADWNATWQINVTFDETIATETHATLYLQACGLTLEQSINETALLQNPVVMVLTVQVHGTTSNIVLFQSTSEVTKATISDLQFHFHGVNVTSQVALESEDVNGTITASSTGTYRASGSLSSSAAEEVFFRDAGPLEAALKDALQVTLTEKLPFTTQ